ncbi:MAG: Aminodeoxychorismate lyase [Chlamydiae bacterium]|nr:Aminodeoxychorismate lyase [Chlamydiota bacterium]
MGIVFCNGQFVSKSNVTVPFNDRGFLFGDGVFTTLRVCNGTVECLGRHLQRLRDHCRYLNIECPTIDPGWIEELIQRNQAFRDVWRMKIIITGGDSPDLDLGVRKHGQLIISLNPYDSDLPTPCALTTFPSPVMGPMAHVKSLSYLERLWIKDYAVKKKFHDAVTTTAEGVFLEAAFSNIFWRKGDDIFTPGRDLPLLFGISLTVVKEAALALGMKVHEVHATLDDVPQGSQFYLCNAMVGFHPVESIGGVVFCRDEEWEERLRGAYGAVVARDKLTTDAHR